MKAYICFCTCLKRNSLDIYRVKYIMYKNLYRNRKRFYAQELFPQNLFVLEAIKQ